MSRLSTTQVIEKGDYLDPGFDANTLTIPTLIGLFAYHKDIVHYQYTPGDKKAKLVEIFNETIKRNGDQLRLRRQETEDILASESGIVNGVTGLPASPPTVNPPRRSGRLSRQSSVEPEPTQSKRRRTSAEPTSKRRASAEPTTGRRTSKKPAIQEVPIISEESEESEPEPQPRRKVIKRKGSDDAGSSRRVSQNFGPGTDDSGWEDNNIFQSGGESSPARESMPKPRKSALRKARVSPEPLEESTGPFSPSTTSFTSVLPALAQTPVRTDRRFNFDDGYGADMAGLGDASIADVSAAIVVDDEEDESEEQSLTQRDVDIPDDGEEDEIDEDGETGTIDSEISSAVARKDLKDRQVVPGNASPTEARTPWWQSLLMAVLVLAVSGLSAQYKLESAPIGFCERDSQLNDVLRSIRNTRRETESCYTMRSEDGKLAVCPPSELVPLPHPNSCTPCPEHATCDRFSMQCDEGYIFSPHPLSHIPYSELANGLPGFGSIAFPPRCVDDVLRKRNIGNLGKMIDAELAKVKGDRICAGIDSDKVVDGGDGRKWGLRSAELIELLRKKKVSESFASMSDFEQATFKVLKELERYGRITKTYDSSGSGFYSSNHSTLTLSCKALVYARDQWQEYRASVFGIFLIYSSWLLTKRKFAKSRADTRRVAEQVQFALNALQSQEMSHHTDPVSHPYPFLSSDQLRDVVLADEHNPAKRRKMWAPIERVIEGNANVQVSLEELQGGAEGRVWSWVGTSGLASPQKQWSPYSSPSREHLGASPFGNDRVYA